MPISAIHRLLRKKRVLIDGIPASANTITSKGQTIIIKGIISESTEISYTPSTGAHIVANKNPHRRAALYFCPPAELHSGFNTPCYAAEPSTRNTSCAEGIKPYGSNKSSRSKQQNTKQGLQILFESSDILVLNKPCNLLSHGADSLETEVREYLKNKITASLSFKSGPLHRLDKPTSGIITFSTSLKGAQIFSNYMRNNKIKKTYIAILDGVLSNDTIWEEMLVRDKKNKKTLICNNMNDTRAKSAFCDVRIISINGRESLVSIIIKNGRTHQIRACAAASGHPIAGDVKYGSTKCPPFFLHAASLEFMNTQQACYEQFDPVKADNLDNYFGIKKITAPLPVLFRQKIKKLFGDVSLPV
ncbi:MAG: hypothetical protein Ta2B_07380 [Termitinemataceae bacterium]|nr:MAG: hypothetical protein Ta2B_07380 [Termitinemataceae bacterium]